MKTLVYLNPFAFVLMVGCTAQQGVITGDILTGSCDVGMIVLGAPGAEPICASIDVIEQAIASRKVTATPGTMTQADLYAAVKASGKYTPARVK